MKKRTPVRQVRCECGSVFAAQAGEDMCPACWALATAPIQTPPTGDSEPSGAPRVSRIGTLKESGGKPDWSLLPGDCLEALVRVYEAGAEKYSRPILFEEELRQLASKATSCVVHPIATQIDRSMPVECATPATSGTTKMRRQDTDHGRSQIVTQIVSIKREVCAHLAMRGICDRLIPTTLVDKLITLAGGNQGTEISMKSGSVLISSIQQLGEGLLRKPGLEFLRSIISPSKTSSEFSPGRVEFVGSAAILLEDAGLTLIMIMRQGSFEVFCVDGATRDSVFLEILSRVSSALCNTYAEIKRSVYILENGTLKRSARDSWREGIPYSKLWAAIQRHLWAFHRGENLNPGPGPETGLEHLAQAAWGCLTLMWTRWNRPDLDDRWKATDRKATDSVQPLADPIDHRELVDRVIQALDREQVAYQRDGLWDAIDLLCIAGYKVVPA